MGQHSNQISFLKAQIHRFLDKYYLNLAIRGVLWFLASTLASYLLFSSFSYFLDLHRVVRFVFLSIFLGGNTYLLGRFFLMPLLRYFSVLKRMSDIDAARLIGSLFPDIDDRIVNTLQLHETLEQDASSAAELLAASVAQKTEQLRLFEFSKAIDFNVNKKYLKYVLPGMATLIMILIFIPSILTQGSYKLFRFDKEFLPFTFELNEGDSTVEEGSDIPVSVTLRGERIPDRVYIITDQGKLLMQRSLKNKFYTLVPKVKVSGTFSFEANGYESRTYNYQVTGKNVLGKIAMKLIYPKYLNKSDETIENAGDLTLPEGTKIVCSGNALNCKKINITFKNSTFSFADTKYSFSKTFNASGDLKFVLTNKFSNKIDSSKLFIHVIKDEFPQILVNESSDSLQEGVRYFNGIISDDYGLTSLFFHYSIVRKGLPTKKITIPVSFNKGSKSDYTFAVDFRREEVQLEDKIQYYFSVTDNDGVNGHKSSKSYTGEYILPNLQQLNEERIQDQAQTKKDIEKAIQRTEAFEKAVDKLKKDISNSKSKDWNNKQQIQQLKEEQKSLSQELQQIKDQLEQSSQEKNQLSEIDKELLEKQEMIEKLLEEVMDEELKKLLEEIEKLFNERADMQLNKELNKLDQSAENMTKQLDRTLEMLKKLQVNERIDDIEKELKETAKEQDELMKKMEDKSLSKEQLQEQQKDINNKFDSIQQQLKDTKELNKELMDPLDLDNTKMLEESIDQELENAKEQLSDGKKSKSKESQKNAADQMEELAEQLNKQQSQSNQQQAEEDMALLRQILESLMVLSFDQETLIEQFNRVNTTDPKYKKLGREQVRINSETNTVRDSLLKLAMRQPKVATFIDKELQDIAFGQSSAIEAIDDHRKSDITISEQQVMTAYNNLALLLNEALQQMQAESQSMMQGNGSCSKPGNGKPKPGGMSSGDMKEMLKKQLERMQKGQSPGGKKPGDKDGDGPGNKPGSQGMNMLGLGNKEIAKMAAEQTAIRQRLEQLRNELNKDGKGSGNGLNPLIKELEQQERDLINKNINSTMINRQQEILTRLLESEKALMERGYEEKRESKSGQDQNNSNLIELKEYNRKPERQKELLDAVDPAFNMYYKTKAEGYFNMLE